MELNIIEGVVFLVIIVEILFLIRSLVQHSKLESKIDDHINKLDDHINKLDDHVKRLDDHIKLMDGHLMVLNEVLKTLREQVEQT